MFHYVNSTGGAFAFWAGGYAGRGRIRLDEIARSGVSPRGGERNRRARGRPAAEPGPAHRSGTSGRSGATRSGARPRDARRAWGAKVSLSPCHLLSAAERLSGVTRGLSGGVGQRSGSRAQGRAVGGGAVCGAGGLSRRGAECLEAGVSGGSGGGALVPPVCEVVRRSGSFPPLCRVGVGCWKGSVFELRWLSVCFWFSSRGGVVELDGFGWALRRAGVVVVRRAERFGSRSGLRLDCESDRGSD